MESISYLVHGGKIILPRKRKKAAQFISSATFCMVTVYNYLLGFYDTLFSLVRQNKNLPDVPLVSPPALTTARGGGVKVILYIEKVQKYLIRLTYNHTGPPLTKYRETACL